MAPYNWHPLQRTVWARGSSKAVSKEGSQAASRVPEAWGSQGSIWGPEPEPQLPPQAAARMPKVFPDDHRLRFPKYVSSETAFLDFKHISHFPTSILLGHLIETPTQTVNFSLRHELPVVCSQGHPSSLSTALPTVPWAPPGSVRAVCGS